ncbi:UNVERIFIED_CONTAM: hypothetical protein GTU68_017901 [Idotea baltica]|nr:hypothetical protein [Idotea baltica]
MGKMKFMIRIVSLKTPITWMKILNVEKYQPSNKLIGKYEGKICLDKYEGLHSLGSSVTSKIFEKERKDGNERHRVKDKKERATVEQVLDPRTRMVLFKILNRGVISEINGCISSGKEANVYHAADKESAQYAIKIYKTSILIFKDRDKYVSGDYKFRHGYAKHNPRKMVQMWAEKEMSNLFKLYNAGLPVPRPVLLRLHVLVMEFLGTDTLPAPLLKDADISESKARELYQDLVTNMWIMYRECNLVHSDLSEFNLLYHNGKAFIIDVSQSVTPDHPHALEFLRKDCSNITDFFRKKGVPTMTLRQLFDFIVDPTITASNREEHLDRLRDLAANCDPRNISQEERMDEELFKQVFIPKTFDQVINFERDLKQLQLGERNEEDIHYRTILGMKSDMSGAQKGGLSLPTKGAQGDSDSSGTKAARF